MIHIEFEGKELRKIEGLLAETRFKGLLLHLAEKTREGWIDAANRRLTSTRLQYTAGIQVVEDEDGIFVGLHGPEFVRMVEHGASSYQIQEAMLQPGQMSRVIPFRFSGPDARGTTASPLGRPYGADGPLSRRMPHEILEPKALGRKVHREVKKLQPGQSLRPGLAPRLRKHHTTDLYAGIQRVGGPKHGQYRTFRTISRDTEPKWLHPGIAPRNIREVAYKHLQKIAGAAVRQYVSGALGGGR